MSCRRSLSHLTPMRLALLLLLALTGSLPLAAQADLVILVRHAEKAGETGDPELTPEGAARAEALVEVLEGTRLDAIITTQYRRTYLTAEPVARAQGRTPVVVSASGPVAAHARAVAEAVNRLPAGSAVLVVGHSNTLGHIVGALGGPALPDLCDAEFATVLILDRSGQTPRLLRARFGAPDPPEAKCR